MDVLKLQLKRWALCESDGLEGAQSGCPNSATREGTTLHAVETAGV